MPASKFRKAIRVVPCQVLRFNRNAEPVTWTQVTEELFDLSRQAQQITNDAHARWLQMHMQAGNHLIVREWMADYLKAVKTQQVPPKCPIECWPDGWQNALGKQLRTDYPELHSRCVNLLFNDLAKKLRNARTSGQKYQNAGYANWLLILAGRGRLPSFNQRLPILFDRQNMGLIEPDDPNGQYRVWLRLGRVPTPAGRRTGSVTYEAVLKTTGKYVRGLRQTLQAICHGEYALKGSRIVYDQHKRNWYVKLAYQRPKQPTAVLDRQRPAILIPARERPLALLIDGHVEHLRYRGRDVQTVLRKLGHQFRSRQESYKQAGSSRKGKGRGRATMAWRERLARGRRGLKTTKNQQFASAVIRRCVAAGCGWLIFYHPTERQKPSRFLERAGTFPDLGITGQWDWEQLKSLLSDAAAANRIEFSCWGYSATSITLADYDESGGDGSKN